MANEINLYDRRSMLQALHEAKPPRTFLLNTFFKYGQAQTHDTESIDIDIKKSKRIIAQFQSHRLPGKTVEGENYFTATYKPGYIKPKTVTTADDILKRGFGEARIYGPSESPSSRAAMKLGEDLGRLRESIVRKMENMAVEALNTGKLTVSGDGIETYVIDFMRNATHNITLTGTNRWSESGSDPIKNVRAWRKLIAKDSGMNGSVCVMGSDAWDDFLDNAKVQALLDKRRIELGTVAPRDLGDGVQYQATIDGVEYYTYDEWYYDQVSKTDLAMMPSNKVFLGDPNAYCGTHFGAIKDLDVVAVVPMFPKTWTENDPSARFLLLQSAPLVALSQSDAFVSAQVID